MNEYSFVAETENIRLDKFLSVNITSITRSYIQKLIDGNNVTVNGKNAVKKYLVKQGDKIFLSVPEATELEIKAEPIPLDVVYEDTQLLVINKSQGMVVHPAIGNYEGTLVNALLAHCREDLSGINGVSRPGIVHRIDKNTSGLIIVAKTDIAHVHLAQQIKEHSFRREYEAIVMGNFKDDSGTINMPIGRSNKDRKKMTVTDKNAKNAVTHYEVITRYQKFAHIKCILETGRTHQIRVHMAYVRHPVLGDDVYGNSSNLSPIGQCLHAKLIGFIHPISNEYLEFTAPVPEYFQNILDKNASNII